MLLITMYLLRMHLLYANKHKPFPPAICENTFAQQHIVEETICEIIKSASSTISQATTAKF